MMQGRMRIPAGKNIAGGTVFIFRFVMQNLRKPKSESGFKTDMEIFQEGICQENFNVL